MIQLWDWLKGKKTYLVAIIGFILAGCKGSGIEIPDWVIAALAWLGLLAVRHGMSTGK